eukprot:766656-Hanusia_phi.AAC.4
MTKMMEICAGVDGNGDDGDANGDNDGDDDANGVVVVVDDDDDDMIRLFSSSFSPSFACTSTR